MFKFLRDTNISSAFLQYVSFDIIITRITGNFMLVGGGDSNAVKMNL